MNTSKTWLWILIAVIVLVLLWAVWNNQLPWIQFLEIEDTTAEIDKDLNAVDVGNPDQDLKQLDADLNQL